MAATDLLSEGDWMRSIAAGDEAALARAYDAHGGLVYGLALRILGDRAEAEEVAQDVFLTLWRTASRLDPVRGRIAGWLVTLTRNRSIDRLRARGARPDTRAGGDPAARSDAGRTPLEGAADAEARARARAAVDALPPDERRVIELAYFEGLSQTEIAARTGTPLGTVKGRARTALERLRDALAATFGGGR